MLGDMAMSHPVAGIGDVEEDVHRLTDWNQDGPDQVTLSEPAIVKEPIPGRIPKSVLDATNRG